MVTKQYPFNGGTLYGLAYSIINGKYPYIPPRVSPWIKHLLSKMLDKNPDKRPNIN